MFNSTVGTSPPFIIPRNKSQFLINFHLSINNHFPIHFAPYSFVGFR